MTRFCTQEMVSTRSRAKAAGFAVFAALDNALAFQLAAARRRLADPNEKPDEKPQVSTRSRAKAAGVIPQGAVLIVDVSTRSRAKAAG